MLRAPRLLLAATLVGAGLVAAGPVAAQDVTFSLGEGGSLAGRSIQLIALITVPMMFLAAVFAALIAVYFNNNTLIDL
jgi:flagellar biosynthetic protein FliP